MRLTVINRDGKYVGYKWNTIEEFVSDMNSKKEGLPMLNDGIVFLDTRNDEISDWWRFSKGITINDLLEKYKAMYFQKDFKDIQKGDILRNRATNGTLDNQVVVGIDGMGINTVDYMCYAHRFDKQTVQENFTVIGHLNEYDDYLKALDTIKDIKIATDEQKKEFSDTEIEL